VVNVTSIAAPGPSLRRRASDLEGGAGSLTARWLGFRPHRRRVNSIARANRHLDPVAGTEKIVDSRSAASAGQPDEVAKIIYVLCTETILRERAEIHINGGQHV